MFLGITKFFGEILLFSASPMVFYSYSFIFPLNIIDLYLLSHLPLLLKSYHFQLLLKGDQATVNFLSEGLLKRLHTENSQNMISGIVLIDRILAK